MKQKKALEQLRKFLRVDKYETFYKAHPHVLLSADDHKEIISDVLDDCCSGLIYLMEQEKKPTKTQLKKVVTDAMNAIATAKVNTENREFGYELCWYLSEKAGLNLKLMSENKIWGYWKIENDNSVKAIQPKLVSKKRK